MTAAELGQIQTQAGYSYQVTPEDILWLARAVQFEGGDHASTIWTYAQRQAGFRRTSSLTSLLRAHSQPINPVWATAGAGKCVEHPDRCQPSSIERRRQARTTPWNSIRQEVRDKVLSWAQAQLPNPVPRAIDFADATVSRSFINRNPGTVIVKQAGNWYLAPPSSKNWPANFVTMTYQGATSTSEGRDFLGAPTWAWLAAGSAVLAAGVGATIWWSRTR